MEIVQLQQIVENHPSISAASSLLQSQNTLSIRGLHGSSRAMFAAAMFRKLPQTYLFVLNDLETAGYFYHDLTQILSTDEVVFFPSAYKRTSRDGRIDAANEILRTQTLGALQTENIKRLIVSYPDALAEKTVSHKTLTGNTLTLSVDEKVARTTITEILDSYEFEQVDYVYEPGQYALRGSIIDIFSFSNELPYRVDFFGDQIESIRAFEVDTQLSKEKQEKIHIIPQLIKTTPADASLFSLLPTDSILGIEDIRWIESRVEALQEEHFYHDTSDSSTKVSGILSASDFLQEVSAFRQVRFDAHIKNSVKNSIEFQTSPQPLFHKNFELISQSFQTFLQEGYTIYILSDSKKQHQRLHDIFEDRKDNIAFVPVDKTLHEGFSDDTLKICCFTDHQIFQRFHKYKLRSDKARSGKMSLTLKEINQLQVGDFVVHIDHGVGRFSGLTRLRIGDKVQEVIKLSYLNNDAVFVSIHSLHKISKYKGKEGDTPKLNKLGSGAWERTKQRTKSKIKDIARDLIKLYAQRMQQKGFAFTKDTYLQHELEASFMYEDTPDQLQTTQDIKRDMESERPMDRLVCGDVGFGKTEIAIRAAFKAATDGKQVAVLVPTTVLATQHYHTFKERLSDFPVRVDYLSRARSTSEQRQLLKDLKDGDIDILIGTHRIVGKDVHFKDLGLLIIDEEQKFGVSTKEKLKQLKINVDTLTLTATPIPRTLQFSLMGARDFSALNTPPPNRYPVQTEVHPFDINIVKDAIDFEVNRNGQVFIVNNRIQNIYEIEALLKREIPDIRIAVGHGQMNPKTLEKVIADFVHHEYDVLLATTIIESGIDMPNVNTIIVMDAQNFGLSDLHQLRGRVGRSNRKAFCYLLAPPLYTLSNDSRRRLQAIENFSDLGSGIHIAMQDLDIRGAGNLLGAEQSGFIADLGYETYQKILEEAVNELRKEEFKELYQEQQQQMAQQNDFLIDDVLIESDLELMFPAEYIPNDAERISIYRELDSMESETDIMNFTQRVEDRFGKIPPQGKELIRVVRLRRIAKSIGFEKIVLKNGQMTLFLISDEESPYYQSPAFDKLLHYVQKYAKQCILRETNKKRSVIIRHVESVEAACAILTEIKA